MVGNSVNLFKGGGYPSQMNLFQNALLLDPQNVSYFALTVAGAIWLVMALVLLVDIVSDQAASTLSRIGWAVIVLLLPLLGTFLYGFTCLVRQWNPFKKWNASI